MVFAQDVSKFVVEHCSVNDINVNQTVIEVRVIHVF